MFYSLCKNKCLGWVPTSPAALPRITACALMYLTICIECRIHSVCLIVPNCIDLSEPLYCLWEILNPHFEIKILGSILALYRSQRNSLSKVYSLPLSIKKSILSICPVYSSSLSDRHRNWGFQLNTKYGESHNKIMRVGNTIFSLTFCCFVLQWGTPWVSLKSCE